MDKPQILRWLEETRPAALERLYKLADTIRCQRVGNEVHLRGLIEISNTCCRSCAYCGISALRGGLKRYRMTRLEILAAAFKAKAFGYGTVVLQAGEDKGIRAEWLAGIIRAIKEKTRLAITLSLGERTLRELKIWKKAGADRYLLRFETSDRNLFRRIHPPAPGKKTTDRIKLLRFLRGLGYETGSGVMIGIPGQTFESLANDILLFRKLDLDMIGVGPFIPHPETPLGATTKSTIPGQVPNTEEMAYKVIALARIACPEANIPSTTALATLNRAFGREKGLRRGANVVMPNLTPLKYRRLYELYPAKACLFETAEECRACLKHRILGMGRKAGKGAGERKRRAPAIFL